MADHLAENAIEEMEATSEVKSLTTIYYDCLERIFDFLDLKSLLNVADTCKRLRIAAVAKFGDDHENVFVSRISLHGSRTFGRMSPKLF